MAYFLPWLVVWEIPLPCSRTSQSPSGRSRRGGAPSLDQLRQSTPRRCRASAWPGEQSTLESKDWKLEETWWISIIVLPKVNAISTSSFTVGLAGYLRYCKRKTVWNLPWHFRPIVCYSREDSTWCLPRRLWSYCLLQGSPVWLEHFHVSQGCERASDDIYISTQLISHWTQWKIKINKDCSTNQWRRTPSGRSCSEARWGSSGRCSLPHLSLRGSRQTAQKRASPRRGWWCLCISVSWISCVCMACYNSHNFLGESLFNQTNTSCKFILWG